MKDLIEKIQGLASEQNLSMLLGVLVVILIGNLLFNYFKSINKSGQTTDTSSSTQSAALVEAKPGNDYVVQAGDSLWSISMASYGTGYNWSKVYEANKDVLGANPNQIEKGTKIALPVMTGEAIAPAAQPTVYTTVKGDHLWSIAIKQCNSGYAWGKIAAANHLRNPNHIEVGQKLTIACK